MMFLIVAPIISAVLIIIGSIASICGVGKYNRGCYTGPMDYKLPDGEEYKDKLGTPPSDNPTIAEQLDGRLTNVFKDPMEGIL